MNDKAIEFESIRFKVAKAIKQMETAGLKIQKFKELYEKIITECNNSNQTIPASIINSNTNFASDCLIDNYSKAIKELELLYYELSKYEIYIKVSAFATYLKTFIGKQNKTHEDFNLYRTTLIEILNNLIGSNTLDYNVEGDIIENIYKVTYYFIKEELKYLGNSKTLESLSHNEIHMNYLDKQIIRELERINLKNPKYKDLLKAKKKIEATGFNNCYVNATFIRQIISYEFNHQKLELMIDELIQKINDNIREINRTIANINDYNNRLNNKKELKFYRRKIFKNLILFISSASVMAGIILGSIKITKLEKRKYNNKTTTYSVSDGINTESHYDENKENSTIIYETTPYKNLRSFHDYFYRVITAYDVSELADLNIEEYLNLDLEKLDIPSTQKIEKKDSLNEEDLYNEIIRSIKIIQVDLKDYQENIDGNDIMTIIYIDSLIILFLEFFFIIINNNTPLIGSIINITKIIKEINKIKNQKEIYYPNKIKELNEKYMQLSLENENAINILLHYHQLIENNSEYEEAIQKIDKVLKLVRKK